MVRKNFVDIVILRCRRCGYRWVPHVAHSPKRCAKCKSKYWDTPVERRRVSNIIKRKQVEIQKDRRTQNKIKTGGDDPHYEGTDYIGS